MPASGVRLSCAVFTAPVEVTVVDVAQRADAPMPLRTSLPSWLPPDCRAVDVWSAPALVRLGLPTCSLTNITLTLSTTRTIAAAKSAQPCRWLPANCPNM